MKRWAALLLSCITLICQGQPTVVLHGVEGPIKQNILSRLTLKTLSTETEFTERQIESLALNGKKEIQTAVQPFGYYSPIIEVSWQKKRKHWEVQYSIALGTIATLKEVDFTILGPGSTDTNLATQLEAYTPEVGTSLIDAIYEKQKKQLLTQATELGYLDATFSEHDINVNKNNHSAELILTLDSGQLYTFGPVTFSKTPLEDSFLRKYLTFSINEPYSAQKMLHLQSALRSTDYFKSVAATPLRTPEHTSIPIHVQANPNAPQHYLFGAGYTTDTGARGRLGWTNRYINRHGHRFSIQANIAEKRQQWSSDYQIPGDRPWADRYNILLGQTREEIDHRMSNSRSLGINSVSEIGSWQRILQLQYLVSSSREFSGAPSTHDHFVLPSLNLVRLLSDDPINPNRGYRFDIALRGSIDTLLSSETFFQVHSKVKALFPLFSDNGHLILRTELGTTTPKTDNLPIMLRFFAGGDRSIRGYSYHSLGPTEPDSKGRDAVVGGKHLFVASAEYDYLLLKKTSIALFVDTGNALNHFNDPLKTGIGLGLRWRTPIGPIRVDLAHPLHSHGKQREWRLHLTFGPDL